MHQNLYTLAKALHAQHLDTHGTLQTLLMHSGEGIGVHHGCLLTFDVDDKLRHIYVIGSDDISEVQSRATWEAFLQRGFAGHVFHGQRQVVVRNIASDPRWVVDNALHAIPQTGSAIGIPFSTDNKVDAVLILAHSDIDYFTSERLAFLEEVTEIAEYAIRNLKQHDTFKERTFDTRYEAIFEHTPVPVVLTDENGIIVDANYQACEFLGFQRIVLRGIPFQDVNVVSAEELAELDAEEEQHFRTETYDIDGNQIPTLIRARYIELDGSQYVEWVMQDMSVQMELEQLRSDLTAMVYHDLRGPLGSIHMAIVKLAQLLQGHDNPAVLKIMQLGLRSAQQVSRLVESLLDIQRLEQGATMLDKKPSEVHVLLTDVLQLMQAQAESHGITIDLDIPSVEPVMMDDDMISRVIINLTENAIKYTPDGGHVLLSAERVNKAVMFTIKDDGPGIPPDMRDSIFDKFSRVKYQNAPKGVGLGLAFCRLAVDAHGGNIWVESDGKNGSSFIFTLPVTEDNELTQVPTAPLNDFAPQANDAEGTDKSSPSESSFATTA
ncbi:MAG: ATP-binding protein [Chloroflexota bacterium]